MRADQRLLGDAAGEGEDRLQEQPRQQGGSWLLLLRQRRRYVVSGPGYVTDLSCVLPYSLKMCPDLANVSKQALLNKRR